MSSQEVVKKLKYAAIALALLAGCDATIINSGSKAGCNDDIVDQWYKTDQGDTREQRVEFTEDGEYVKYLDLIGASTRDYYDYNDNTCTLAIINYVSKKRTEYDIQWQNDNKFCAINVACYRRK